MKGDGEAHPLNVAAANYTNDIGDALLTNSPGARGAAPRD